MDLSKVVEALGMIGFLAFMLLGAGGVVVMLLWILTPFSVFAIRRRVDEQQILLAKIERRLGELVEKDAVGGKPLPPL